MIVTVSGGISSPSFLTYLFNYVLKLFGKNTTMTIQIEFTPETLGILKKERHTHPVPLVRRRLQALWLKSRGLPNHKIAVLVGVYERTLRDYFQLYNQNGVEGLKNLYFCFG
jgi:hypothetical protein